MGKVKAPAPKAKKYMTVEELALTIDRNEINLREGDLQRIKGGNNKIMFDVANQYLKLENNQRAMDWFQKAHHTRHPTASIEIAKLFYYGKGTPKDLDQAKKYFKKGKYAAKDEVRDFLARIDKNEKTKTKRKKQDKSL